MKPDLHRIVASIAAEFCRKHNLHPVFAPECGGANRLQLFASENRCREASYCWPDISIINWRGKVNCVIEVEQSGVPKPSMLAGKYLPIALSRYLGIGERPLISLESAVTFIHVLNADDVKARSKKLLQYENMEADMRTLGQVGSIATYHAVAGTTADFVTGGISARRLNSALQQIVAGAAAA